MKNLTSYLIGIFLSIGSIILMQSCSKDPSCADGEMNGTETGVDCGGDCIACATSAVVGNSVAAASCSDGIQNGTETGVDCGGSCAACNNSNQFADTSIFGHWKLDSVYLDCNVSWGGMSNLQTKTLDTTVTSTSIQQVQFKLDLDERYSFYSPIDTIYSCSGVLDKETNDTFDYNAVWCHNDIKSIMRNAYVSYRQAVFGSDWEAVFLSSTVSFVQNKLIITDLSSFGTMKWKTGSGDGDMYLYFSRID